MLHGFSCLILVTFFCGLFGAGDFTDEKCPRFQIRRQTIVKTQQSIHSGAVFLGKEIVENSRECHHRCCKLNGCNLALLKYSPNDYDVTCFLFNCGSPSRCSFRTNSAYHGYAALVFEEHKTTDRTISEVLLTTSRPATPQKLTTRRMHFSTLIATSKPKWNEYVEQSHQKHHTVSVKKTTTSTPQSQPDFLAKVDEKLKSDKDWLYRVRGKISTTPQSTKSDQEDADSSNGWNLNNTPVLKYHGYDGSKYGTYDRSHDVSSKVEENHKEKTETKTEQEDEDFPRRVFVDNNPEFPDEPLSHRIKTTATPFKTAKASAKAVETQPPFSNIVIKRFNIQENKAVIPLAVGLVLALLLLMGVIFRLKTSRRRRTKAFLTDDADYLINGMYL